MPVHINYKGRTGNKLFQYIAARVFSEKNNLNLKTDFPDNDTVEILPNKIYVGDVHENQTVIVNSHSFIDDEINFQGNNKKYIFDDYFHNGDFMSNNQNLIKSFFKPVNFEKNTKDIVIHLRLFDYLHFTDICNPHTWEGSEIINPSYYTNILDNETYDRVYIVTDEIRCDWEKRYLNHFKKYDPIMIQNTPKEDFNFMMSFNKIINSNSTFSYWASFLSEAEKIYTFKNTGYYGRNLTKVGDHVKNVFNIKNNSIIIDEGFYYED